MGQRGWLQAMLLELPQQSWAGRGLGCHSRCQRGSSLLLDLPRSSQRIISGRCHLGLCPQLRHKGNAVECNVLPSDAFGLEDGDHENSRKCTKRKKKGGEGGINSPYGVSTHRT